MLVPRAFGVVRCLAPPVSTSYLQLIRPAVCTSTQVRFGSMKVKRIQRKHPLDKNKARKLIKGTRLEVKRVRKPSHIRDPDPNKYIDVKEIEFDPFDLLGRSTLKVFQSQLRLLTIDSSVYACNTRYETSATTNT
jgi:hypothetical protein